MYLSSWRGLVWRNMQAHPLRSTLTAIAITLGVAMMLAATIIGQAASDQATAVNETAVAIHLQIISRDNHPFPQPELTHVDIAAVLPFLQVEAMLPDGTPFTVLGIDPVAYEQIYQPELVNGRFLPTATSILLPIPIALSNGLNSDDTLTLQTEHTTVTLTVSGRIRSQSSVTSNQSPISNLQSPISLVPLSIAQQLAAASNHIDRLELSLVATAVPDTIRTDLAQQLDNTLIISPILQTGTASINTFFIQIGLGIVGLIILFAAAFVIMNAFSMAVTARTEELGALRALGMKRRQVMRLVLSEAAILGLIGAILGVGLGLGLAAAILTLLDITAVTNFTVPLWGLIASPLIGLLVTMTAVLVPARRASQVPPIVAVRGIEAMAKGRLETGDWRLKRLPNLQSLLSQSPHLHISLFLLIVPLCILLAVLLRPNLWWGLLLIGIGMALLLLAMAWLLPVLIPLFSRWCRPLLLRWWGTDGRLASDNLARNPSRMALTAGALTASLTVIIATSGFMTFMTESGLKAFVSLLNEDLFILPDMVSQVASGEIDLTNLNPQTMMGQPLDEQLIAQLEDFAAHGDISLVRYSTAPIDIAFAPAPGYPVLFTEMDSYLPLGNFDFSEGDLASAQEIVAAGPAIFLQPLTADKLDVVVGDSVTIPTPQGDVAFTVAGIGGNGWMVTAMPYEARLYFEAPTATIMGVIIEDKANREQIESQLRTILQGYPSLAALDTTEGIEPFIVVLNQFQRGLNGMLLLAVFVAGLGVINTMMINVAERKREIGLLRAVGSTQRQVRRMVVAEAAILGLMAALLAGVMGFLFLALFTGVNLPNGLSSIGLRGDWEFVRLHMGAGLADMGVATAVSLILGPLIAALAAYYPARLAARTNIITVDRHGADGLIAERIESRKRPSRNLFWSLAWRNLSQNQSRTILSATAVGLGTAMVIASDFVKESLLDALFSGDIAGMETTFGFLAEQMEMMLTAVGYVILVAATFLVYNAFAMTVTQRQQQIGTMRSLGMTRRQVMRLVLLEAGATGGIGVLAGLLIGPILGQGIVLIMRSLLGEVLSFGQGQAAWQTYLIAAVLGVGLTLLSVLIPARRATRVSPLAALRESGDWRLERVSSRRSLIANLHYGGLLIIAILMLVLLMAPPGGWAEPPLNTWLTVLFMGLWLLAWGLLLPALIGLTGRGVRRFSRRRGANGRLIADNLQRERGRVMLTITTLALGLIMIVGLSGFLTFAFEELLIPTMTQSASRESWGVFPFDIESGPAGLGDLAALTLPSGAIEAVKTAVGEQATIVEIHFVYAPELSFLGNNYFSYLLDVNSLWQADVLFSFTEGDWQTAEPLLQGACSVLLAPAVAQRNGVGIGDVFTVSAPSGPLACVVAGIGSTMYGGSIIHTNAAEAFAVTEPLALIVTPKTGETAVAVATSLQQLESQFLGQLHATNLSNLTETQAQVLDLFGVAMSGILLLAVGAAALGVVNTMVMSVYERRQELGLLRAVGSTRRQVQAVIMGEAALMGFVGGVLGLVVGVGTVVILGLTYGGGSFGLPQMDLWAAVGRSLPLPLLNGAVGLIAAPLICALAARWPARALVRGTALQTMNPTYQTDEPTVVHFWQRGSIRTRLVVGTAVLMVLVLTGVTAVLLRHARDYFDRQTADGMRTMVQASASLIELNLEPEAQTLDTTALQGSGLDSGTLLVLRDLLDKTSQYGFSSFTLVDADNVVLFSFDPDAIGSVVPPLAESRATAVIEADEEGHRFVRAMAPIQNEREEVIGSVRLQVGLQTTTELLQSLGKMLGLVGGVLVVVGVVISWAIATPLVRTTNALTNAAKQSPISNLQSRISPRMDISLRTRLTAVLALLLILLMLALEAIVVPLQQQRVEADFKRFAIVGAEWMAQLLGASGGQSPLAGGTATDLGGMMQMLGGLDIGRLQLLNEEMRGDFLAYLVLADMEGTIQLSDQVSLIGAQIAVVPDTEVVEGQWQEETIWLVTTPFYEEGDSLQQEPAGLLQLALHQAEVETFLAESRLILRFAGVVGVLAGILLAQVIGTAVTAPIRQLTATTRRLAEGDLTVQFQAHSRDELAVLAQAFNEMVAAMREREWLRDVFGRFVSQEVAEAIRTGQVKLEGENRVVSVLFCDIRGFTARSEQVTPAEMVALLNEYLPVVVQAAQQHGGTVNKFGGDSTLIIYGAPKQMRESAYQAVLTAVAMQQSLVLLNERLQSQGIEPIRIGVGINTGTVLAGAVGPPERQEYTVIGDTVNLASRIEALNKEFPQYGILMSGQTYEALGTRRDEFELVNLGDIHIRGKVDPVAVWAVLQ